MKNLLPWDVLESRDLYKLAGRIAVTEETVRLPDGTVVRDYVQVSTRSFAIVFAETTEGSIICFRQYKHGPRRVGLCLPAGGIEKGENALDAARRELLEETGYESPSWHSYGEFAVSGNQGVGTAHLFRATGCKRVAAPHADDIEEMVLELKPRAEVRAALANREFTIVSHAAAAALGLLLP